MDRTVAKNFKALTKKIGKLPNTVASIARGEEIRKKASTKSFNQRIAEYPFTQGK